MSSGEEVPTKPSRPALRVKSGIAADIPPCSIRTMSGQRLESDTSKSCIHSRTLAEAGDRVRITEMDDEGSVSELRVANLGIYEARLDRFDLLGWDSRESSIAPEQSGVWK